METRAVIESLYLAHPVVGDLQGLDEQPLAAIIAMNLDRATRWLGWLVRSIDDVAIRCSWLGYVRALPETPELRERGLRDDDTEAATCAGIVLCGGKLSSGMRRGIKTILATKNVTPNDTLHLVASKIGHERARYTGDGDPGCVGNCLACSVEAALHPRQKPYVLDLLDLGNEPPDWDPADARAFLERRLTTARATGTNGPTTGNFF